MLAPRGCFRCGWMPCSERGRIMLARFRRKWRLPMCLWCVSLGLMLLCLGSYNALAQIPPPATGSTVEFSENNYTVSQGQTAVIVVTLNTSSQQSVSVNYATSNGTAQAG